MYYKIRDDVLFRQYENFGLLSDNSEYGYRMLNDKRKCLGEKYVSLSGSIMLGKLGKKPRLLDNVINDLLDVYIDVEYDILKKDVQEFFDYFVVEGFLSCGKDEEDCTDKLMETSLKKDNDDPYATTDCLENTLSKNDFLRSIHIDVATACNERCIHCYIPNDCKKELIDPNLFYRIIEEGRKMNVLHVTLSGGEPLLHKNIIDFLKKCRELDLSVNVLSNLTLLNDEIITEMKKNNFLSVQVSLYSMDAKIHDSITNLEGSFNKSIEGILRLCNEGIPVQISCPIIKQNKDSFVDVLHWGWKHDIAVAVEPMIFTAYDHSRDNVKNRLSLEEIEDVLSIQMNEGYAFGLAKAAKEKEMITKNDPICSVCRYSFCVSTNGEVFPCAGWQKNVIGDLKKQTLQEIWRTSEKIKELRQIKRSKFSECVDCKDRGYCTVCMMWNSNENSDGDPFKINKYRCRVAAITHDKVKKVINE